MDERIQQLANSLPMEFDPEVQEELAMRSQAIHDAWTMPEADRINKRQLNRIVDTLGSSALAS